MILRDVIVASDRERLRSARAPEGAAVTPVIEPPAPVVVAQPPSVASLTLEGVCDWLLTQSADLRAAVCARCMAPDLEALAARAREAGRELGQARGREEVLDGAKSGLAALSQAVAAGEQTFAGESAQLADRCAEIVAEVLRKLIGPALVSRDAALGAVLEVLSRVTDERELTLWVSPEDLPFLESQKSAIQEALGTRSWSLYATPRVSLGGCLVESSLGTLDGRLEIQLQELSQTLRASKTAEPEAA